MKKMKNDSNGKFINNMFLQGFLENKLWPIFRITNNVLVNEFMDGIWILVCFL